ncbi:MAG: Wzz/FepE/Etk N-terminal domain-containing protein [Actinomycetota bacterium]
MDVYRALWRRRFLIAILTIATVATTYVAVSNQTKVYKSTTLIRVQQQSGDPNQAGTALGIAQHLAQTYAQIASTDAIANRVFRALNGRVPRSAVHLSAQPVQDLELLYISATSSDPNQAALVANTAATQLGNFIRQQPPGLRDQIEVVNPAGVSSAPISPRVKLSLIIALLAGLIFNGGLALLIEFLADRLPDVDDLEALTGKPVLATVPPLTFRSANMDRLQQRLAEASQDPEGEIVRQAARSQPRRSSG